MLMKLQFSVLNEALIKPERSLNFWPLRCTPVLDIITDRLRELVAVPEIVFWDSTDRRCQRAQIAQNDAEQAEADVQADRFADVLRTLSFQQRRKAGWRCVSHRNQCTKLPR